MKKNYALLALLFLMFSCIDKPEDIIPENKAEDLTAVVFPENFKFQTEQSVNLEITDTESGAAVYQLSYNYNGAEFNLGKFVKTSSGLSVSITIPSIVDNLKLAKKTRQATNLYQIPIQGGQGLLRINSVSSSISNNCVDELFAVNNNGHFFKIDLTNDSYEKIEMPNLKGGGSIANTLDQENGIMYYNVGKTLYIYDIATGEYTTKYTSNPYNGSYPRLAYKDGFF